MYVGAACHPIYVCMAMYAEALATPYRVTCIAIGSGRCVIHSHSMERYGFDDSLTAWVESNSFCL